jgi:hypothetical protein
VRLFKSPKYSPFLTYSLITMSKARKKEIVCEISLIFPKKKKKAQSRDLYRFTRLASLKLRLASIVSRAPGFSRKASICLPGELHLGRKASNARLASMNFAKRAYLNRTLQNFTSSYSF